MTGPNQQRENLWERLEAEMSKAGLEVVIRGYGKDTRNLEPLVKFAGRERTLKLCLSFACVEDWREPEIQAAIRQAKQILEE